MRLAICLVLLLAYANGQAQEEKKTAYLSDELAPGHMRRDLDSLHQVILRTHQDPYFYTNQAELHRAYQSTRKTCGTAMTRLEFAEQVAGYLNTLEDSHTYLQYRSLFQCYDADTGRYLGVDVLASDGKLYVRKDRDHLIPAGAELLTINGAKASFIFNEVSKFSVQEGRSLTGRTRITELLFINFAGFYVPLGQHNTLTYKPFDKDTIIKVTHDALTREESKKYYKQHGEKKEIVSVDISQADNMAVLHIPSFSSGKRRKYYHLWSKFAFIFQSSNSVNSMET